MLNRIFKYGIFIFIISLIAGGSLVSAGTGADKYEFKFVKTKVYNLKTDIWIYDVLKNGEQLRTMNVYVASSFDGARILVDSDFNTSWNMFYFSKKRSIDNFWDSYRMTESTVISLDEAVNMAVDHYIADQIANK